MKQRLVRFYGKYAPEKLEDDQALDDLLKKSQGKEEKLFEKLVAKYGPEPPEQSSTAKPAAKSTPSADAPAKPSKKKEVASVEEEYGSRNWWRARLLRFYAKYAPEKTVQDMDAILDKAKDDPVQLDKLFRMLEKKYGPEPDPSSESEEEEESEEESEEEEQVRDSFDAPKQKKKKPQSAAEMEQELAPQVPDCLQRVVYCPVDGVPPEFSEYFPDTFKSALPWLAAHVPALVLSNGKTALEQCNEQGLAPASADDTQLAPKAQARSRDKKKSAGEASVVIELQSRRGKKAITMISGLELCVDGLRLKDAAKLLGKKFASGCSVKDAPAGGKGEIIEIQGDFIYDLPEILLEFYPTLDKKRLFTVDEDGKKTLALS